MRCSVVVAFFLAVLAVPAFGASLPSARVTTLHPLADGYLCGTARGLFAFKDTGAGSALSEVSEFVTGIASNGTLTLVGTPTGAVLIDRGRVSRLNAPSEWTEPAVTAVAAAGSRLFAAGALGVAEITAGAAAPLRMPSGERQVLALSGSGTDLLVAFADRLMLYRPDSKTWIPITTGSGYVALAILPGDRWLGARGDGGADMGKIDPGSGFAAVRVKDEEDPILAFAVSEDIVAAGTLGGRVLLGNSNVLLSSGLREVWRSDTDPCAVRTLSFRGPQELAAGTEGAGATIFEATPDAVRPKSVITSEIDRHSIVADVAEAPPPESVGFSIAPAMAAIKRNIRILAALAGVLVVTGLVAMLALFLRRRPGRRDGSVKEKRRSSRRPSDLPTPEELSPELRGYAERLHAITSEINELSRLAALGRTEELGDRPRRAMEEFEKVDTWMRQRYEVLKTERAVRMQRIQELKNLVRQSPAGDTAIAEEMNGIEHALAEADRDERFLRFTLEE